ncbi:hypothetical protein TKK_0011115 [Trichogramma kaykai]
MEFDEGFYIRCSSPGGDSKGSDVEMVPPDGGWGWFVLIAAVMVNFLIPGGIKSFGVLYKAFLQNFNANESTGSWIPALCYFLYSSLGPLSSVLSVKYSYRTVTLVGGTFAAVGMMLSYFATSIQFLYVSYGIFVGIGAGLAFPPTVYITTSYFVRLRGLANGFCISGSALGSIIMPPVITHMLRTFSVRGVILIMGALTLNTWACALLYQPLEKHLIPRKKDNSGKEEEEALRPLAEAEEDDEEEEKEKGDKDNKDKDAEDKKDSETGKGPEVDIAVTSPEQEDKPAITSPTSPMSNAENSSVAAAQMAAEVTPVPKSASSVALENYYNKQPPPHSRLRKISMPSHMAGQMHSTPVLTSHQQYQLHHMHQQRPTRRSTTSRPPLMSPSQSSFNYISTPYHGSTLTALHPEFASTLTLNALSSTFRHKTPEKNAKKDAENVAEQNQNKFFDYRLLLDPMYLVILISNSTNAISYTNFVVVLTIYADKYLGFTDAQASLLLTIISAFDLIGRVGGAALSDTKLMPKHFYFVGGLFVSGISLAVLPIGVSFYEVAFYCSVFGLASGIYVGVTAVVMADMLGVEKLTSSYGISLFVNGVLQLVGPPICSKLAEVFGWGPIFTALGIVLVVGAGLWGFVPFIRVRQERARRAQLEIGSNI